MSAIYKKELRSYLTSMVGYVFMAFILLIIGIYFSAINIGSAWPRIGDTLSNVTFVFLICVPILTMRVIAEERRQKTDQLLLTAPVKVSQIVNGKYFALVSIYLIPVLVIAFYPLILRKFGEVSLGMSYTAILGFLLLGCAEISIGVFLSSVTENQVIAAVLAFLVLFVSYVSEGISGFFPETAGASLAAFVILILLVCLWIQSMIKNVILTGVFAILAEAALVITYVVKSSLFEGSIQKFIGVFNITDHLTNFTSGILDISGIVYYLSIIVIMLFLATQSIQKRRWN
ncbi:MAG: ABC transporter permease [Lachnospiraceae bacterium]|nr:ABC transporter permease [Lachnospiraceae bacterium]